MDNKTNFLTRLKTYPLEYFGTAVIGGLIAFVIAKALIPGPNLGAYPPDGNDPQDLLTLDQIGDLYYRYAWDRATIIDKAERSHIADFEAVRSVTFEYQDLKNYIDFIEKNSIEANIKISGLRFYYGKYKNDRPDKQKGRQMLFFNPTVFDKTDQKDLAYAIDRTGGKTGIAYLRDIVKKPIRKNPNDTTNTDNTVGYLEKLDIINEASALSFLNFSSSYTIQPQAKNGGGQQSPPPYDIE
ncbi:hypothetical protein [Aquimarina mytili]|uniref:Uncharacterized protein n=1 Tax=Aquimarina mytili TaxID=874423 RepID=A0A936ZQB4_9FLAO|nr:hypothetical protein [Aquimarina mytili]MBL0683744.1 hypothetical protein [Aquimarina mytili]